MTKPIKAWKPAKRGTTEKYAGILGFPDLEGEKREQLIERIMDILGSHNQDLYSSREIANKILEEIEKQ